MTPLTSPVMNEHSFLAWIDQAQPGDSISYYEGLLGVDRARDPSALPGSTRSELDRIADHAMALAKDGCLLLVQRRIAEDRIAYIAIKASGDKPRRN